MLYPLSYGRNRGEKALVYCDLLRSLLVALQCSGCGHLAHLRRGAVADFLLHQAKVVRKNRWRSRRVSCSRFPYGNHARPDSGHRQFCNLACSSRISPLERNCGALATNGRNN